MREARRGRGARVQFAGVHQAPERVFGGRGEHHEAARASRGGFGATRGRHRGHRRTRHPKGHVARAAITRPLSQCAAGGQAAASPVLPPKRSADGGLSSAAHGGWYPRDHRRLVRGGGLACRAEGYREEARREARGGHLQAEGLGGAAGRQRQRERKHQGETPDAAHGIRSGLRSPASFLAGLVRLWRHCEGQTRRSHRGYEPQRHGQAAVR